MYNQGFAELEAHQEVFTDNLTVYTLFVYQIQAAQTKLMIDKLTIRNVLVV